MKDSGLELIGLSNATQVPLRVNFHQTSKAAFNRNMVRYQIEMYGCISNRCVCIKVAGLILTLSSFFCKGLTFFHETVTKLIEKTSLNS